MILDALREGEQSIMDILSTLQSQGMKIARQTLTKDLSNLISQGKIEPTAPARSKKRKYRLSQ